MKKINLMLALGGLLALTACQNDDLSVGENGKVVEVSFDASLPGTRAYGDGTTAKDLYWAVYDKNGKKVLTNQIAGQEIDHFPANSLHTNVTMQLVTGETYDIVFWAQNAAAPYSFVAAADGATVTAKANYPTLNNQEILDAFYCKKTLTVKADELNQEAELKRPFAQLNIATDDKAVVEKTGTYPNASSVTLSGIYTSFDLMGEKCIGETTSVTFNSNFLPEGQIEVAGKKYDYLSMTYVFAPADGYVQDDVTMTVNHFADGVRSYGNIPLRQNYKTNIVGSLLTSTVLYDVYINPIFDTPDYVVSVQVSSAAELKAALADLKSGDNVAITATNDITMDSSVSALDGVNLLLDLGDKTLTQESGALLAYGGNLVVQNGTVVSDNSQALYAAKGSSLTVSNVEITQNADAISTYASGDDTIIELTDVTINQNSTNKVQAIASLNGATVNMNGVTLEHKGTAAAIQAQNGNVNMSDVTINSASDVVLVNAMNGSNVTVSNLTVAPGSKAKFVLQAVGKPGSGLPGSHITADNVTADISGSPDSSGIVVMNEGSSADLNNIHIKAESYGLSSNATAYPGIPIIVKNSSFEAKIGVMYNVPGTFNATKCEFIGTWQGAFIRGGEATLTDCKVTLNADNYADATEAGVKANEFTTGNWGSGASAPSAALTYGNRLPGSYAYPTTVTLNGCEVSVIGQWAYLFPVAYGYQTDDFLVKLIYDAATKFTGGKPIEANTTTVN